VREGEESRETNFNPRAYVRHDSGSAGWRAIATYFNPRAYVRHDVVLNGIIVRFIFQSTCLREARRILPIMDSGRCISIHVPT